MCVCVCMCVCRCKCVCALHVCAIVCAIDMLTNVRGGLRLCDGVRLPVRLDRSHIRSSPAFDLVSSPAKCEPFAFTTKEASSSTHCASVKRASALPADARTARRCLFESFRSRRELTLSSHSLSSSSQMRFVTHTSHLPIIWRTCTLRTDAVSPKLTSDTHHNCT